MYLSNLYTMGRMWQDQFKQNKASLNSEFSFSSTVCLIMAKEPSPPSYLLRTERRTNGFMPFPKASHDQIHLQIFHIKKL